MSTIELGTEKGWLCTGNSRVLRWVSVRKCVIAEYDLHLDLEASVELETQAVVPVIPQSFSAKGVTHVGHLCMQGGDDDKKKKEKKEKKAKESE